MIFMTTHPSVIVPVRITMWMRLGFGRHGRLQASKKPSPWRAQHYIPALAGEYLMLEVFCLCSPRALSLHFFCQQLKNFLQTKHIFFQWGCFALLSHIKIKVFRVSTFFTKVKINHFQIHTRRLLMLWTFNLILNTFDVFIFFFEFCWMDNWSWCEIISIVQ